MFLYTNLQFVPIITNAKLIKIEQGYHKEFKFSWLWDVQDWPCTPFKWFSLHIY